MAGILMVVEKSDHRLSWYDIATGARIGEPVALPSYPHEFVVDAENRFAYVSHYGVKNSGEEGTEGRSVIVVDIRARKVVHSYDTGIHARPHGIELDALGRLYVQSEHTATVLVKGDPRAFDQGWDHITPTGGVKSHLFALTADGTRAYAMNLGSGDVTAFNPRDTSVVPVAIKAGDKPEGRYLSADERTLYVSNRGSATISVIDTESLRLTRTFSAAPDCNRIWHDARRGRLVTINYLDQSLSIHDEVTGREILRHRFPARALAMQTDPEEKSAFVALDCEAVHRIDLDTFELLGVIATGLEPDVMHILPRGYFDAEAPKS